MGGKPRNVQARPTTEDEDLDGAVSSGEEDAALSADLVADEQPDDSADEQPEAEPEPPDLTITIAGRVFDLGEPDFDTYMLFINKVAEIGLRSQRTIGRMLGNLFSSVSKQGTKTSRQQAIPIEATVFAFLQNLKADDVWWLGGLALFGAEHHEAGLAWMDEHAEDVKMSHLIKAIIVRVKNSGDLLESVKIFGLLPTTKPTTAPQNNGTAN